MDIARELRRFLSEVLGGRMHDARDAREAIGARLLLLFGEIARFVGNRLRRSGRLILRGFCGVGSLVPNPVESVGAAS